MRNTQRIVATMVVTLSLIGAAELRAGSCVPGPETLCLLENQFSVEVQWEDFDTGTGSGQVIPKVVDDSTGFFYYDDARYLELMIQVFDACVINNRYWVFAVGLSDYMQSVTVTDTATDVAKTYDNPPGGYLHLTDTNAFATCPPLRTPRQGNAQPRGTTVLELIDGRFLLEVSWRDFAGGTGDGTPVAVTSHSGYFWFFTPRIPVLAVKIFDGSASDGNFWVNFGATNDVEFTLRVTDSLCQTTRTYFNPLGNPPETVSDRTSFRADCFIFADGFESGDVSAWSASVP